MTGRASEDCVSSGWDSVPTRPVQTANLLIRASKTVCGRFTLRTPLNVLIEQFELSQAPPLVPRFNIAPTQSVAVVRQPGGKETRQLCLLRGD